MMVNKIKQVSVIVASLFVFGSAQSAGLDISLSKETAAVNVLLSNQLGAAGADASIGVFYADKDEYEAKMINAKMLVAGNIQGADQFLKLGVGAKVSAGKIDARHADADISYLALGAKLAFIIPNGSIPMNVYGEAFYAPDITAFQDAESALEFGLGFEAEVAPSAQAYIGYRRIDVDFEKGGDEDLDGNVHVGVKFNF